MGVFTMTLNEAFQICKGDVVSLVGGGGKTSLMFYMAECLAETGRVITTTTTKIFPPTAGTSMVLVEPDEEALWRRSIEAIGAFRHVTVAGGVLPVEGKLQGVRPEFVDRLKEYGGSDLIIVEADGARGRSLKAPRAGEPMVPVSTSVLIPVLGIDALGQAISDETVFRLDLAQKLVDGKLGDPVTIEFIVSLVAHPHGICKSAPRNAKVIPFINKVENRQAVEQARGLARELKRTKHFSIDSVVLGSVRSKYFERY